MKASSRSAHCHTCHDTPGVAAGTGAEDGAGCAGAGRTAIGGSLLDRSLQYAAIDLANPSGQRYGNTRAIPVRSSSQAVGSIGSWSQVT